MLVGRKLNGRHVPSVIQATDDHGTVRIAMFEGDGDFIPDIRQPQCRTSCARRDLRDSHKSAVSWIGLHGMRRGSPGESNPNASKLVDMFGFTLRSDHDAGYHSADDRLRSGREGSKHNLCGQTLSNSTHK